MELRGRICVLRPWTRGDEPALVRHANNRRVWIHLTDDFPHPYTLGDARSWVRAMARTRGAPTQFAVLLDDQPVGGVGFGRREDPVRRLTAAVGYWVGEEHWGKGVASDALQRVVRYAFEEFDFERLEATVFEGNAASCRVLEKAGFALEGRFRRSILKDGRLIDSLVYARFRQEG